MKTMKLADILAQYTPGDSYKTWQEEFDFLWSTEPHIGTLDYLTTSIQETGMRVPVDLGDDGRVWNGHHRLAAAHTLGIEDIPVNPINH